MGMYTELILGAKLKENTPKNVIDTLEWMCRQDNNRLDTPPKDFPFPLEGRYRWMLHGGSYYFGVTHGVEPYFEFDRISNAWIIATRSNLKNYSNEIETFLAWLKPHIEQGSGNREFYAIVTYEEASEPTIYYLKDNE
jgi:hypothetical protein